MSIISRMLNHFTPFKTGEDLWHGSLEEKKAEGSREPVKEKEPVQPSTKKVKK